MQTADILVIGGGMAGVSAAAALSSDASVILLERETAPGYHSTGRSAAIFVRNYGNETLRALNAASEAPLREADVLSSRGELLLAGEQELDALEAHLAGSGGLQRLTAAEALELCPILRPERIAAAAIERDASDIDVDRLLQGYAKTLRTTGGRIVTNAEARTIEHRGAWRVDTVADVFEAPILVNAAGAWADEIAELAGVRRIGLQPMRRSAALLPAPDGHDVRGWPMVGDLSETWYAKPDAGRLMVSPADEDLVEPHDAWADDMVLAEGLHRFEQAVTVPVRRVEQSWAGLRSFVCDRTPVAGFAPGTEGFFWLAGQGGYGIQTAPALSRFAADLILGRETVLPQAIASALSPARESLSETARNAGGNRG